MKVIEIISHFFFFGHNSKYHRSILINFKMNSMQVMKYTLKTVTITPQLNSSYCPHG